MATLKGVALKGDVMNIKEEILAQMDSALRPEFDKAIDNTIEGAFKEDVKTLGFMVANSIKCQWEVMKPHLFYSYCLGVKAQEARARAVPEGYQLVKKELNAELMYAVAGTDDINEHLWIEQIYKGLLKAQEQSHD